MKRILFLLTIIVVSLFFYASSSKAITIGFDPLSQTVPIGTPVDVNLYISDLGSGIAPSLSTFDLDISFDLTILTFSGVTFGDPILGDQLDLWGLGSITGFDDSVSGVVNLFELSLDLPFDLEDFQADSFILATLTFDTLLVVTSPLNLSNVILGDAWGDPLTADVSSGSVTATVTPVPEPSTLLLLVSGLAGMGVLRRKFKICGF